MHLWRKSIKKIYQENLGWPLNTLYRFKMFQTIKQDLQDYDYIFFFNANMIFKEIIEDDEILIKDSLIVAQHPGFFNKTPLEFTYDRNTKSTAYIPQGEGKIYVMGGLIKWWFNKRILRAN